MRNKIFLFLSVWPLWMDIGDHVNRYSDIRMEQEKNKLYDYSENLNGRKIEFRRGKVKQEGK